MHYNAIHENCADAEVNDAAPAQNKTAATLFCNRVAAVYVVFCCAMLSAKCD